jgi:cell shape-determining protein MreC
VVYLFQVTKTNSFSYALQEVESQKAALSAEREDLRNENARLQSAQNVNSTSTAQKMTSPVTIEYAE